MKIKVLLISRNAWNNTSGNTLTNLFQNFSEEELAQIYCRDELPDNKLCTRYYKISESQLIKSIFNKRVTAGEIVEIKNIRENKIAVNLAFKEKGFYDFFRSNRLILFLWIRELIWLLGNWKTQAIRNFILDFKPDIIYGDAYDTFYTYNLLNYVKSVANVPVVLFHSDDQVTFRQFSFNPLYWINRIILRNKVSRAINLAYINYCIIDEQKEVYQKMFRKEFKILNKCSDFNKDFILPVVKRPVKIVYAGNIYYGRWRTLVSLADAIETINANGIEILLEIYTSNNISGKIYKKLDRKGFVAIKGYLPYNEIRAIQNKADVLMHVESFQTNEKLLTALSFSTKLVDYFESGKCILAIGWSNAASIKYLQKNDSAIVVSDLNNLQSTLSNLISHPQIISDYARKAFNCGRRYHNKSMVLSKFRNDLLKIRIRSEAE